MPIILILLLLTGCSHNGGDITVSLGTIYDTKSKRNGFNERLHSFQFLLKHAIDDMLNDLHQGEFGCIRDFTLDISFTSPELYHHIQQRNTLQKKALSYKFHYTLYNINESYSGKIETIDAFVIPSNAYADILSKEDSEIAGINNLVKQLEHELTGVLHNICQQMHYKQ
jgi:hypothetical protein